MKVNYKKDIQGKSILITGGTGSFGSTMMKSLLDLSPKRIIIFSRDELKQFEMRNMYQTDVLSFVIGDVRDRSSVDKVMQNVDIVFNAAALKQVPTCEYFPLEAIKTNVLGSNNVINSAIDNNIEKVVILSTDKAVYPINAMGMTKALMEKIMLASSREVAMNKNKKTTLCGVRYGNVMYSRGSVIPFFVGLIKRKHKLKITNPNMTRFLLPLSQSVNLVMHALSSGENGNIYVKKAPAADIKTLAEALCKIFNYKEELEIVGIRAGEKMHETLISREEWVRTTDQGDFYSIPPETIGLDYDKYFSKGVKAEEREYYASNNTEMLNVNETAELLLTLPEIKEELSS